MTSQDTCRCEKKSCGCTQAEACRCGQRCECETRCTCENGCSCGAAK